VLYLLIAIYPKTYLVDFAWMEEGTTVNFALFVEGTTVEYKVLNIEIYIFLQTKSKEHKSCI